MVLGNAQEAFYLLTNRFLEGLISRQVTQELDCLNNNPGNGHVSPLRYRPGSGDDCCERHVSVSTEMVEWDGAQNIERR